MEAAVTAPRPLRAVASRTLPHIIPHAGRLSCGAHDGLRRSGCIARVSHYHVATLARPRGDGLRGAARRAGQPWEFRLGPGVLGAPHHVPVTVAGSGRPPASRRSTQEENQEP